MRPWPRPRAPSSSRSFRARRPRSKRPTRPRSSRFPTGPRRLRASRWASRRPRSSSPTAPLFPEYARAKGWVITSADQFRPSPPPALTSALYARDYNETKEIGAAKSTKRTPQQTEAVRFWAQTNFLPSWNQAARELSAAKKLGLADNARLFALLNMGIANVF